MTSKISSSPMPLSYRNAALNFALPELKKIMSEKIGHKATTNYKQPIILATLLDIEKE